MWDGNLVVFSRSYKWFIFENFFDHWVFFVKEATGCFYLALQVPLCYFLNGTYMSHLRI